MHEEEGNGKDGEREGNRDMIVEEEEPKAETEVEALGVAVVAAIVCVAVEGKGKEGLLGCVGEVEEG